MTAILRLSVPMTLWLIGFSAVYALHGIVCASAWGTSGGTGNLSLGRLVLLAAATLAIALQAIVLAALLTLRFGGPRGFMRNVTLGLAAVALLASVWTLAPVAMVPTCTS